MLRDGLVIACTFFLAWCTPEIPSFAHVDLPSPPDTSMTVVLKQLNTPVGKARRMWSSKAPALTELAENVNQTALGAKQHGEGEDEDGEHEGGEHDDGLDGGEHDDGHQGEEHEASEVSMESIHTASIVLSIVLILISLFYFVFHQDSDLQAYTWQVILTGINIFLAVDAFFGVKNLVFTIFGEGSQNHVLKVLFVLALIFNVALELVLMRSAYDNGDSIWKRRMIGNHDKSEVACRTWGAVMAHMAGFASLAFWGEMQYKLHEQEGMNTATRIFWDVLILAFASLFHLVRMRLCKHARIKYVWMDSEVKTWEKRWLEACEEAEIESTAVMLAFLVAQNLRMYIGGEVANPEGHVLEAAAGEDVWHRLKTCILLALCIPVCLGLTVFLSEGEGVTKEHDNPDESDDDDGVGETYMEIQSFNFAHEYKWACYTFQELLMNVFIFVSAWCALIIVIWGTQDYFISHCESDASTCGNDTVVSRAFVAIICTFIAFGLLLVADPISDKLVIKDWQRSLFAVDSMIRGIGLMVGIAWEQVFHSCIGDLAEHVVGRTVTLADNIMIFASSLAIFSFLMPAAFLYINPLVMTHTKNAAEQRAARQREARQILELQADTEGSQDGECTEDGCRG